MEADSRGTVGLDAAMQLQKPYYEINKEVVERLKKRNSGIACSVCVVLYMSMPRTFTISFFG